jgi:Flp pilus assembly protein TadB
VSRKSENVRRRRRKKATKMRSVRSSSESRLSMHVLRRRQLRGKSWKKRLKKNARSRKNGMLRSLKKCASKNAICLTTGPNLSAST